MQLFKNREENVFDGSYPSNWDEIRKKVLKRDGYRCKECGTGNKKFHVHHKIPISEGGSHNLENLITLCEYCHNSKHPTKFYLKRAIKESRMTKITYENNTGYVSKKKVDPYELIFYKNMEFLVGYDHEKDSIRIFRPKRVKYVNITDLIFFPPKNFSAEDFLKRNLTFPEKSTEKFSQRIPEKEKSGCFIATASYGTPHAEEIDILRDFRNKILKRRRLGNLIVNLYYAYSPPIAKLISESEVLKSLVRECFLSPMVKIMKKIDFKN